MKSEHAWLQYIF